MSNSKIIIINIKYIDIYILTGSCWEPVRSSCCLPAACAYILTSPLVGVGMWRGRLWPTRELVPERLAAG
jgi:hypothetical protein